MPKIATVGDLAGGAILGPGSPTVRAGGKLVAVVGDRIAPHGSGPHAAATMRTGSPTVRAGGQRVVRAGDVASCGHRATATGAEVYADETPAAGAPAAPELVAVPVGDEFDILWPPLRADPPITSWERRINPWTEFSTDPDAVSLRVAPGPGIHTIEVRAVNDVGPGETGAIQVGMAVQTHVRTVADAGEGADTVEHLIGLGRLVADAGTAADQVASLVVVQRSTGDAGQGADAIIAAPILGSTTADAGIGADALARTAAWTRTTAETATASDSVGRLHVRAAGDAGVGDDAIDRAHTAIRATLDRAQSLPWGFDGAGPGFDQGAFDDQALIAEKVAKSATYVRSASDAGTAADTATDQPGRTTADTGTGTDAIARTATWTRSSADTGTAADSVTDQPGRATADAGTGADALARTAAWTRTTAETATAADSVGIGTVTGLDDAGQGTDSVERTLTYARTTADRVQARAFGFDGAGATFDQGAFEQGALVQDAVTAAPVHVRTTADTGSAADSVSTGAGRALTETGTGTDAIARTAVYARSAAETGIGFDAATDQPGRTATDAGTGTDSVSRTTTYARSAAEAGTATDTVALQGSRTAADTGQGTDSVSRTAAWARTTAETGTGAETGTAVLAGGEQTRSTADTGTASDSVAHVHRTPARPAAPTLSIGGRTSTSVTAAWADPDDYPAPTHWIFQWRPEGGSYSSRTTVPGGADARSVTVTGLDPETTYHVRVRAENTEGLGQNSRVDITTLEAGATTHVATVADAGTASDQVSAGLVGARFGFDGAGASFDQAPYAQT